MCISLVCIHESVLFTRTVWRAPFPFAVLAPVRRIRTRIRRRQRIRTRYDEGSEEKDKGQEKTEEREKDTDRHRKGEEDGGSEHDENIKTRRRTRKGRIRDQGITNFRRRFVFAVRTHTDLPASLRWLENH